MPRGMPDADADPDADGVLRPPVVRPGERVRLLSPASTPDRAWVDRCTRTLEGWGLVVDLADHALDRWGYMAGRDEDRLADLNDAFRDPEVRAVVTTRGGAGAYRIADDIDVDAVRADPKPLVGFSDVTYLHLALWHRCRLTAIHGCLAGDRATATVRRLLMTTEPVTITADPSLLSAAVDLPGTAEGTLVGGNLTAVATSVGVRLPDLDGAILLLEEPRTRGLGLIDRLLTQLVRSGALDGVRGVALGLFEDFPDLTDRGWRLVDVLQDRLGALGVPVLGGLLVGHGGLGDDGAPDQFAVPLGTTATLDTTTGTLTAHPCVR